MSSNIIDFVSKRKELIEKKRRRFERILFQDIFRIETSIATQGEEESCPVDVIDVSHGGCLFRIAEGEAPDFIKVGSELKLKMYFTDNNHLPISVSIKRTRQYVETDGRPYREYGCKFENVEGKSFQAMKDFINFLHKYAECSTVDYEMRNVYFGS